MKRATVTFILLILAAAISLQAQAQSPAGQQSEEEVLRVSTNLVTLPVVVKTRQGAYIPNLRREDFRVYEDGVEQEISHFEPVDKPFTVTLMLDVSDSTKSELQDIQAAAIAFLHQLQPDDRALIVAFDKQFVRLTAATGDHKALAEAIRQVKPGGGTALYDALDTTITEQLKQIPGRKAIVLLTDGIDTASIRTTYDSTLRSAIEQYALIYPIQWNTPNGLLASQLARSDNDTASGGVIYTTPSGVPLHKAYERGTRYLQLIAQTSGGHFQSAASLQNLARSFARIAEELRQQYSLSYYPQNRTPKSGKRRLKVSVGVPDAVVHARDSYVYKPDTR